MRILSIIAFSLLSINLYAQQPKLKVAGKDSASVSLTKLKTEVKVIGSYAVTTMEMEFCNSTDRILEGELTFPMPEGVSISHYAIDINGKMREAVPVEKEKGQVVFENIVRRNVDPALLEKVEGNNFRTRIYPIPANGCRKVFIGYEQLLTLNSKYAFVYALPLHFKEPIKQFNFSITVASNYIPEVGSDCNTGLKFEELNKVFTSAVSKQNFMPDGDFTINVPKTPDAAEISMQSVNGQYYFLLNTFPNAKKVEKKIPDMISVVWDVSLSGQNRDHKKEFELLDAYIKKKGNLSIHLFTIGLDLKKVNNFSVSGGNWSDLRKTLEDITYDGASNLSKLASLPPADEYLFFSDGLSNWGNTDNMLLPKMPVYTICATNTADHSFLKYVASSTGASFINLNELDITTAQQYLTEQTLQFLGIKPNAAISNVYPSMPTAVVNGCSIAGISNTRSTGIFLQYGYGSNVVVEQYLDMNFDAHNTRFINIEKIWAQKKIAELDIQYEKNKEQITALGKKYSIITRNTSLIVLDAVEDYVRYDIEPPAELMADYTKLMDGKKSAAVAKEKDALAEAKQYFTEIKAWWNKNIKPVSGLKYTDEEAMEESESTISTLTVSDSIGTSQQIYSWSSSVGFSSTNTSPVQATPEATNGNARVQVATSAVPFLRISDSAQVGTMQFASNTTGSTTYTIVSDSIHFEMKTGLFSASTPGDTDGDGIKDEEDKCINERGPASNFGCPIVAQSTIARVNQSSGNVFFDSNSAELRSDYSRVAVYDSLGTVVSYDGGSKKGKKGKRINYAWAAANSNVKINIKELVPERSYLQELNKLTKENKYKKYLELRKENKEPTFYFDVANMFLRDADTTTGYRILSNIAELNLDDHESCKMLGYRLKSLKRYDDEVILFRKVVQLRPQDPQSYRDYALALADAGKYQQALDTLYLSFTKSYNEEIKDLYPGIEEIIVTDMNELIALHGNQLNISKIPAELIKKMPVALRVVLNWNMNDTDIDLWLIDPTGEKCYFNNKETAIGGRISTDFTRGYGPEQFMLRNAIKGKYKLMVNYFGDTQQRIAGSTTVMAEIFINYGTASQQRKVVALQMKGEGSAEVLVAEFTF